MLPLFGKKSEKPKTSNFTDIMEETSHTETGSSTDHSGHDTISLASTSTNTSVMSDTQKRLWSERSSSGTDDTIIAPLPKEAKTITAGTTKPTSRLWSERDTSSSSEEEAKRSKTN